MNIFSFQVTKKSNFVLNTCHYKIIHPIDACLLSILFRKTTFQFIDLYNFKEEKICFTLYMLSSEKQQTNSLNCTVHSDIRSKTPSPDYQLQYR
ncbi:hypothetical protein T07_2637 [Trichinella nelsoni]|uniref:Uncharacterized protein n=1 Tax=Trichinella nelsoni TaxID=6336 RepID=A0A0V0S2E9_9BILA|nr:hypothetical protein T07_2637 [Trichinella nelsoni]